MEVHRNFGYETNFVYEKILVPEKILCEKIILGLKKNLMPKIFFLIGNKFWVWKKFLVWKKFWLQIKQINIGPKKFGVWKIFWLKKKSWVENFFVPVKILCEKIILGLKKTLFPKKNLVRTNFGCEKIFCSEKNFGWKKS